jgi:pyridoxal phosphate enzyme (YggS family)
VPALAERYREVTARIDEAAKAAGRSPSEVTLVVVTKFHPAQLVLDLIDLGARDFGENKDQEAGPKAEQVALALENSGKAADHRWHFVGQLQSNKVKSVLKYADSIHSLDRDSLLQALAKETAKLREQNALEQLPAPTPIQVFIELNLTQDPARGGIQPAKLEDFATSVLQVPGVKLAGVMGVAALDGQAERDFASIAAASQLLQTVSAEAKFISAGMSGDFEVALQHGATHLRIGTAITGQRAYN